jgi:hypothetical protein
MALPLLSEAQILVWADAHHARAGRWPERTDGPIAEAPGENWFAASTALTNGLRGLPGGSSLSKLLARERGVRNVGDLPAYTEAQILAWADAFRKRTGKWPNLHSGPIPEAPGESWNAVDSALKNATRGLAGGTSLARLLAASRGARNHTSTPALTAETILAWADAHHRRTGAWPKEDSGPIPEAPGETWAKVAGAMWEGKRGLQDGRSLARLLEEERQRRWKGGYLRRPPLDMPQILAWADAHHARTGAWPGQTSGAIPEAPVERWGAIDQALRDGVRGLPGGSSLYKVLAEHRGKRSRVQLPPLTIKQILGWADAHRARTGEWPRCKAGAIPEAPGETWTAVDASLRAGLRGLPGGSSLPRLLTEHRNSRNHVGLRPLTHDQWSADAPRPEESTSVAPAQPREAPRSPRPEETGRRLSPHLEALRPRSLPPRPGTGTSAP